MKANFEDRIYTQEELDLAVKQTKEWCLGLIEEDEGLHGDSLYPNNKSMAGEHDTWTQGRNQIKQSLRERINE